MESDAAVAALAALAQNHRLEAYRILVQAGAEGIAAGDLARALDIPPNTLTFHLDRLRVAGLITVRRESRSMIYAPELEIMNALVAFLTDNCCSGIPCAPIRQCKPTRRKTKTPA